MSMVIIEDGIMQAAEAIPTVTHTDSMHSGSAKRDIALGVAGLNASAKVPDANLESSVATHAALTYHVPSGVILMWHGLIVNIPLGYVLCNGANGTPDLRSSFIRGAPNATEAGGTGGADTHTLSAAELPAHDHGSAGSHAHDTIANHAHRVYVWGADGQDGVPRSSGSTVPGWTTVYNTGDAGGHTHSADGVHTHTSVGSGSAHNTMPAYYQILFIMKT